MSRCVPLGGGLARCDLIAEQTCTCYHMRGRSALHIRRDLNVGLSARRHRVRYVEWMDTPKRLLPKHVQQIGRPQPCTLDLPTDVEAVLVYLMMTTGYGSRIALIRAALLGFLESLESNDYVEEKRVIADLAEAHENDAGDKSWWPYPPRSG